MYRDLPATTDTTTHSQSSHSTQFTAHQTYSQNHPSISSPSQLKNVTVLQPVSSYTASEQLAQGCYADLSRWKLNPQPIDHKSTALYYQR